MYFLGTQKNTDIGERLVKKRNLYTFADKSYCDQKYQNSGS